MNEPCQGTHCVAVQGKLSYKEVDNEMLAGLQIKKR